MTLKQRQQKLEEQQKTIGAAINKLEQLAEKVDDMSTPTKSTANSRLNQMMIRKQLGHDVERQKVRQQLAQKGYYIG